jgi:hypothetical protein
MKPSSLYFPLILFLVFTDLTIPHLLAYLLLTRYERHRNVHMGFALLKLRLWIELLAFEASEHCYAVARLALGLDRLDRSGTSTTDISYGVWARRRLDEQRVTTCLKYEFCQYKHIPMFTFSKAQSILHETCEKIVDMSRRINCKVRHKDQAAPHSKIVAVLFLSRTARAF